ncbi:endopeptidase La [Mycoplasma sp. OR1901]|uniref:endopeptidase La n=1 Tax=Mycoplasma sp. OR1901 TaxID=2742195 RepID=UPI001583DE7B|nr:endopeptidase La [Mycoplasma sp. OR1901]QKT05348.1 endopeptidase La [Mycoplasma sp. OR1901]
MKKQNYFTAIIVDDQLFTYPNAIHEVVIEDENISSEELIFQYYQQNKPIALSFKDYEGDLLHRGVLVEILELEKMEGANSYRFIFKVIAFIEFDNYGFVLMDKKLNVKEETFIQYEPTKTDVADLHFKNYQPVSTGQIIYLEKNDDAIKEFTDVAMGDAELVETIQKFHTIIKEKQVTKIWFGIRKTTDKRWTYEEFLQFMSNWGIDEKPTNYDDCLTLLNSFISILNTEIREKMDLFLEYNLNNVDAIIVRITEIIAENFMTEKVIADKMNSRLSNQQKEFILREKLKSIQDELEEMKAPVDEDEYLKILKDKNKNLRFPSSIRELIKEETKRVSDMMPTSPEANISKTYISLLKKLPWRLTQKETLDINHVKKTLDKYHYGIDKVKERILEYIAVIIKIKQNQVDATQKIEYDKNNEIDLNLFKEDENETQKTFNNVPIICLVGPPGTGKTSLSKAIAESLQRKFVKISLGGVSDESEIRGHRRTYVGAMPGKIIKGIKQAGVSNPVVLLDEIDKMASTNKGDPASAMLEVLDPEQNSKFQDHYLENEYDLSKVVFIATANYYDAIPHALRDRIEVIELSAYTLSEKLNIAKKHLLPKVIEQVGEKKGFLSISDKTLEYIISNYTIEAGVRGLKRVLDKIARKFTLKSLDEGEKNTNKYKVEIPMLKDLLGPEYYKDDEIDNYQVPGVVNGLAYTTLGGTSLQIEVNTYPGKGEIKLTGSLKDVMQESAKIALSYVKANAEKFGIKEFDFDKNTIHIHVPEGATPKDGPSAGVTFTTALISALSGKVVPHYYGMTGEITLRGRVLNIGGLKEKSFAATQKKLKYVFIPFGNESSLVEIPEEIKKKITYIPVKYYDEIFDVIFNNKKPKKEIKTVDNE